MYMFSHPYQRGTYQHLGYPASTPLVYTYNSPDYEVQMPREGTKGFFDRERDRKRPSHMYPQKSSVQPSHMKETEHPIDGRYFHIENRYVPVQIVDADKLRRDREDKDREERVREERRRVERKEDNIAMRETWESTDYTRKSAYRHSSGQHRDKHTYDHRRTTRVYHTNPAESAVLSSQHGTGAGNYLVRREEYVSRVKEYEVYQTKKWPIESRDERSRMSRPETKGYQWGKGHLRTKD